MATIDSARHGWVLDMDLRLKTGKFKDDGWTEAKLVGTCGPIGTARAVRAARTGGEMGDTYRYLWGGDVRCSAWTSYRAVMKFDCGALRSRQYTFVPRTQVGFMMKSSLN